MQLWMMPKSDQIVEKFQKFPQLYLVAHSCRYIEPDWKRTIYQPKMDIFIKLFSQYKGDWPYRAESDTQKMVDTIKKIDTGRTMSVLYRIFIQ